MKTNKGGISRYCKKHKIKVVDLADIVGVTFGQLYLIDKDPLYPVKIMTLQKIYTNTKLKFKDGLRPQDYLDFEILHKK